jgi:hypothetical protein
VESPNRRSDAWSGYYFSAAYKAIQAEWTKGEELQRRATKVKHWCPPGMTSADERAAEEGDG